MQKIIPNLWFDKQAEEAAEFYVSLLPNSKITAISHYPAAGQEVHGQEAGSVMDVGFELDGYQFLGLNGGPHFKFNPSVSFIINSASEDEVRSLWSKLSDGGKILMELAEYPFSRLYGWCEDRYGLSWQIILANVADANRPRLLPSLLFAGDKAGQAQQAIDYYLSVFKDAKPGFVSHYGPGQEPDAADSINFADFMLEGQTFAAMDSAREHDFDFNEAVSFIVNCQDQAEIDYYWDRLTEGGQPVQCGWLKDRFGFSWQVVPTGMDDMLNGNDKAGSERAMKAMLNMVKIDIAQLERAYKSE